MTKEEVKSFLPILQAFADGKEIECHEEDKWYKVLEICNEMNPQDYRIKPEPKYRPFKDAEECWQEMQKHQPFGWLKDKNDGHLTLITVVDNDKMMALNGRVGWDFLGMMNNYVFADGTPFGVKIEKEE